MDNKETAPVGRNWAARPFFSWLGQIVTSAYRATLAKTAAREILVGLGIYCALVGIMQIGLVPQRVHVAVGKPVGQAILAPRQIEDRFETFRLREEAGRRAKMDAEQDPANWYISPESGARAEARLAQFMNDVRDGRERLTAAGGTAEARQASVSRLRAKWTGVSTEAWEGLLTSKPERLAALETALRKTLISIEENERLSDLNLQGFRDALPQAVRRADGDPNDRLLIGALRGLVVPNLELDQARVDRLVNQAKQRVATVYYQTGQPILEKGEVVTEETLQLLKSHRVIASTNIPLGFISLMLFVLLLIVMALGYLHRFQREIFRQERLLYLMAITMTIAAIMGKFFALEPESALAYFAPVTFASILWVLLLDAQVSLMLTVLLSLLMGVVTEFKWSFTLYTLVGGCTAIFVLSQRKQRSDLMMSGLFIGLANLFSVFLLTLLSEGFPDLRTFGLRLAAGAFNGVTAAVIAIGLLPFLENLFGLTSAIRLLETANPNQPLLRQLLVEAPGTYHHSIIVGNLAEAAADSVGADALLVRVGAYYHDIGKIKRPYFFVENQIAQDNPHEKLTPTLSTLIITAHVKEGVELARQAGLPETVVDILEQHHGTDLVRYFYARAAESAQSELAETDFRYDGPRPQTKEAALVMLADSVEAAVRSMVKPTPAKIEALTTKIIKERLADGQFDQCDLTLRDLEQIKSAFLKVLGGIFHSRIEYPESILREFERKKGTNGDSRKQPTG
ncbi:MAG: HD family phosphohydrolase [Bacteroidota bacterium]